MNIPRIYKYRPKFEDNVFGWPGYYVSKRGSVWCRHQTTQGGRFKLLTSGYWYKKPISYHYSKDYTNKKINRFGEDTSRPKVRLSKYCEDGAYKKSYFPVSRLVALVYIPNPHNYPFVCHKDNNPKNNYYKNLYWGTAKMNMEQASRDGRMLGPRTQLEAHSRSKLTNFQKVMIWHLYYEDPQKYTYHQLANIYKVSISCISTTLKDPRVKELHQYL